MEKTRLDDDNILYDTFHVLRELGRGGMGRVLEVRADRHSKGFRTFLASSIAWQEVMTYKDIAPLRLRIAGLNRNIQDLIEQEADLMDNGEERAAEDVRYDIDDLAEELRIQVESLKKRQQSYIDKRSLQITQADPEAMIKHLNKIGLPYPDDDIFAMKQVLMDDRRSRLRLQDEFKSLKLVQHENIIAVYDVGKDYYITEYIPGIVDPDRIIVHPDKDKQYYTNVERISIVIEAAKAVEQSHLFGVVHRDIKPDNIAVNEVGNVKLIDFGLVKSVETEGQTRTGIAMGTPYFMSLEQIESAKDASPTFDIYALGATLYNYLTGEKPYARARNKYTGRVKEPRSAQDVFLTVCNMSFEPIPPSEIADGIPYVLEDIILKAIAKEQHFRYQSVREFREDLEKYLSLADDGTLKSGSFFGVDSKQVDMRIRRRHYRSTHERKHEKGLSPLHKVLMGSLIGAFFLLIIGYLIIIAMKDTGDETVKSKISGESEEETAKKMYEYAEKYAEDHAYEFAENIDKFKKVRDMAKGTQYELKADDMLTELKKKYIEERDRILADLDEKAQDHISRNKYDKAIALYEKYDGKMHKYREIRQACTKKANEIRRKRAAYLRKEKETKVAEAESHEGTKIQAKEVAKIEEMDSGWINLIQGNSKEEAGWGYPSNWDKKADNFHIENSKIYVLGSYDRSVIKRQDIFLGDCELEFDYVMDGNKFDFSIWVSSTNCDINFRFDRKAMGNHHVRILMEETAAKVFLDSNEIKLDGSEGIRFSIETIKNGKALKLKNLKDLLKGSGQIQILLRNTNLTISNLRYRLLDSSQPR